MEKYLQLSLNVYLTAKLRAIPLEIIKGRGSFGTPYIIYCIFETLQNLLDFWFTPHKQSAPNL